MRHLTSLGVVTLHDPLPVVELGLGLLARLVVFHRIVDALRIDGVLDLGLLLADTLLHLGLLNLGVALPVRVGHGQPERQHWSTVLIEEEITIVRVVRRACGEVVEQVDTCHLQTRSHDGPTQLRRLFALRRGPFLLQLLGHPHEENLLEHHSEVFHAELIVHEHRFELTEIRDRRGARGGEIIERNFDVRHPLSHEIQVVVFGLHVSRGHDLELLVARFRLHSRRSVRIWLH